MAEKDDKKDDNQQATVPAAPSVNDLMNVDLASLIGGTSSKPRPLGVPEGYVATPIAQGPPATHLGQTEVRASIEPRYREGKQYEPSFLPPEDVARLQTALDTAGLYSPKSKYRLGLWEDTSIAAYVGLLEFANRSGMEAQQAMRHISKFGLPAGMTGTGALGGGGAGSGTGGTERDPLTITLSSPDDLRAVADRTARKALGRKLSDNELSSFVSAYQQMQSSAQRQDYNLQETGGTVVAPPTVESFAEAKVQQLDPLAHEAKQQVNAFTKVADMISSHMTFGGKAI